MSPARLHFNNKSWDASRLRMSEEDLPPQVLKKTTFVMERATQTIGGRGSSRESSRIHLYAEHLQNIRTLSIQATLATVSNTETKATLSADGSSLTLTHEGEKASIQLPINVPGGHNDATLTIPAAPSKDLSFRVKVEEKPGASGLLGDTRSESDNYIPWMASELTVDTEIACIGCASVIVKRGAIKSWKNLPSEGWAEMMDFWHCHKPTEPHEHVHTHGSARGISANSRLAIEQGVGLVGQMDLVFAAANCSGVTSTNAEFDGSVPIQCSNCNAAIGTHENTEGGIRLRKPRLAVSSDTSQSPASYPLEKWIAGDILGCVDVQGVRKFLVSSGAAAAAARALKLWVFTPDVTVSSSGIDDGKPIRVVKLMWQDCTLDPGATARLDQESLSEGEIQLPEFEELRLLLSNSGSLLPSSAKEFQGWHVGLLRRFSQTNVDG